MRLFHSTLSYRLGSLALGLWLIASVSQAQLPVTSGLTLHLRADSGVQTVSGDQVIGWHDLSGNSRHMTNYFVANRPLLVTNVLNGQPVIRFDGIDDYVDYQGANSSVFVTTDEFTIFTIFQANAISQIAGAVYNQDMVLGDQAGYFGVVVQSNLTTSAKSVSLYNFDGSDDSATVEGLDTGSFRLFMGWHTNSTIHASTFLGINSSTPSGSTSTLGGFLQIGRGYSSQPTWFNGDIAEVVIYNRALSDSERSLLANRLADNYGLSIPEPSVAMLMGAALLLRLRRR